MNTLDQDDFKTLKNLDFFEEQLYCSSCGQSHPTANHFIYGYQLYVWKLEKPYKDNDNFLKKWFLSFFPDQKVKAKTPYIFMVENESKYYWYDSSKSSPYYDDDDISRCKVSFEEVFNNSSKETQENLIYHLDIFR